MKLLVLGTNIVRAKLLALIPVIIFWVVPWNRCNSPASNSKQEINNKTNPEKNILIL